ncbi:MAG: serine/threonine protein kinase [Victivallaceae bacterium]|nr:serine/threonine protein kinase [Victivallaceae bacterium]
MSNNIEPYLPKGKIIGDYTVLEIAGVRGGTATVYLCEDYSGKKVAIKRFHANAISDKMRERIYEESNMNLKSSYLVTSMRVFEDNGYIHSVMPFIRGKSLSDILCCGDGVAEAEVIHLGTRLAIAACDLHRQNILSTDIKPDNILINAIGHVKMIDLTCFERIGKSPEISLGTEPYAAPELAQRQRLSAATDIYSIGMVMHEALVGTNAFITEDFESQLSSVSSRFPRISRIITKSIEPSPQKRYQAARSLLNDLNGLKNSSSTQKEFSFRRNDGGMFKIPVGSFTFGRKELAPQSLYISEKQFEFDYDGTTAKVRDIANKNQAFLNNTLISNNWMKIKNSSHLEIADINLKFNLK